MQGNPPLHVQLAGEIKGWALLRAAIVLLPFWTLSVVMADPLWIEVSLLAIATMIVEDRLDLKPLGVLLHGTAIISGIYLLLFAQLVPALYVLACMLFAAAVIRIGAEGQKLRALGSWTFIPALILANEVHGGRSAEALLHQASICLPYLLVALTPTFGAAVYKCRHAWKVRSMSNAHGLHWFSNLHDFGPKAPYGETMAAMAAGVGLAALLVEHYQMQHGQWVIWGVASVVTGTVDTARAKLRSRANGGALGVPLGIVLGQFVIPHSGTSVTLATLATFLTLVSFRKYVVAYFFRSTFVALAITLANQSAGVALERLTHVLLGGAIGIACVLGLDLLARVTHAGASQ